MSTPTFTVENLFDPLGTGKGETITWTVTQPSGSTSGSVAYLTTQNILTPTDPTVLFTITFARTSVTGPISNVNLMSLLFDIGTKTQNIAWIVTPNGEVFFTNGETYRYRSTVIQQFNNNSGNTLTFYTSLIPNSITIPTGSTGYFYGLTYDYSHFASVNVSGPTSYLPIQVSLSTSSVISLSTMSNNLIANVSSSEDIDVGQLNLVPPFDIRAPPPPKIVNYDTTFVALVSILFLLFIIMLVK